MGSSAVKPAKKQRTLNPETLLSSLAVVLVVNVVQRSVGFGRSILFCRWLDPETLGHWEMAIGFMLLAAPLIVFGLPGSFGRYLEKYREQGQLKLFLRRTACWTFGLTGVALTLLFFNLSHVANLVFGDASQTKLAAVVVGGLGLIILHHFLEAIFAGLRLFRIVSIMHFAQSMGFAVISLALVTWWEPSATSLVIGYAGACLISAVGVLLWSFFRVSLETNCSPAIRHKEFWPPLMRFAIWIWVTNLLTNLFAVIDRYMILHFGGYSNEEALTQVGNYHTSMIVPILLISIANLLVGAMTPHLSHDWEQGRRDRVVDRLNFGLKITSIGMLVAGVGVLFFCPLLFTYAFENKYAEGLAVLPWTTAGCIWFSLVLLGQTYIWCAEKSHRASLPLMMGLFANVLLNLFLMPIWGLMGAVVATGLATLLSYLTLLSVNHQLGMRVDRGTIFIGFAPLLLTFNGLGAAASTAMLLVLAFTTNFVFTPNERQLMAEAVAKKLSRWIPRFRTPRTGAVK